MELENLQLKNITLYKVEIEGLPSIIERKDTFKVILKITNNSSVIFRRVKINVDCPYMLGIDEENVKISKIEPYQTEEVVFNFIAVHGGRDFLKFNITITELFDRRVQTMQTILSVKGKGLYRGDNHTHSTRSDGQNNNSVFDNAVRVRETRALSWITPTDHCYINTQDCDDINKVYDDFVAFPNSGEYGAVGRKFVRGSYPDGKIGEHGLQYNVNFVNNKLIDGRVWQDVVDETITQGGLFYIAHPFAPTIWWDFDEAYNLEHATGIEVWQGDFHPLDTPNRMAFDLWDKMNSVGKKMNGIANSDGHFLHRTGHPFIMAKMDSLTRENIHEALKNGHFYGSNGVHISFTINGKENNEVVYIKETGKARFAIRIYDTSPILNIKILKNTVKKNPTESIIFKEYNFNEEINDFFEEFTEDISPNDFYRLEVITKEGTIGPGAFLGDYYGLGFGFTNPIYIEKSSKEHQTTENPLETIEKNIKYTKSSYPYVCYDGILELIE